MSRAKRHNSIIPLSREHHYALMLCLRIHRGVAEHRWDLAWLQNKAKDAIEFFECDLKPHFKAEEEILFPSIRELAGATGATGLLDELLSQHRRIEELIEQLRNIKGDLLAGALNEFADTLEAHIRKEERELFPVYEQLVPPLVAQRVEEGIIKIIGTALQPRRPELIE